MGMRASNCLCTDLRPKLFPKCSYVSSVMGARTNRGALLQLCRAGGTSSDPDHRRQVARLLELAENAGKRWDITHSDFLSPTVVSDAMLSLSALSDLKVVAWGGYAQAERVRLSMGREEIMEAAQLNPSETESVVALEVKGNFMFDPATHPDFLGAILGTGIVREKVGDVLIQGESGAQILVDPELLDHFLMSLTQVRTVPVTVQQVPLSELFVAAPRTQEVNSVEASLRLDAIASAGFKVSRSKMADLIKGGDVRVNWQQASRSSVEVKQGDMISCAGKGRLEIKTIEVTKKDKYVVAMLRYV